DPTRRSGGVPYISIKVKCAEVEELRRSRLLYEIFVHSARMEGIHLRGAPVSRGGIRWSDRPDDFRTEVLGLAQTQMVKNAVIVPGGSKGGFVTRLVTDDRDALLSDEAEQYRTLIRGMLDITDTIVDGRVTPPPDVVRHDGDDPYLVVAADKGTAHLSDTANEVAAEYDFWLGDAFASGGSYGYDHKKEGITARGAWECVKRHFWELGKNIQEEPFTVVGIGDMSGDVFGNGMLLSRQIRLVAAFDHRHIFLDPDPDPATSYEERERLFRLPRSTWDDYDRSRLSAGGMIVPRHSKEVTLSPEARRALGAEDLPERLDGEALVRAVLRAPVELLWNGGIGTYVKDAAETHGEAGDATNDPVRVDAHELRCQVIGEGGNLGLTQRARVAFALGGGRLNTDALDNSGGVDMSDHEVNLKILLNPMLSAGEIALEERNRLLASMTEEVSERVLDNSRGQSMAVSLDQRRSRDALQDFAALIRAFERDRILERDAEGLPGSDTLQERAESGIGLTRPALAVLLAYAKLEARSAILASGLPDDPALLPLLRRYFPDEAVATAGDDRLGAHRLRREIVVTVLVNDLVNLMGASFLHRHARDTGAGLAAVARAWVIANGVADAEEIRRDLARVPNRAAAETVYRWLDGLARVLDRTTQWALANIDPDAPAGATIQEVADGLGRLRSDFPRLVAGEDRALFDTLLAELEATGTEHDLAQRLITLRFLPQLLDILRTAREGGHDAVDTARAYYLVSERFGCAALRAALRTAEREERWEKRLVDGLIEDIGRAHRRLARTALSCLSNGDDADACVGRIHDARPREVVAYRELLEELESAEDVTVAGYAVAVRLLRDIAG
ncbi:MAG: NAD-glutamate dehydrogenase domain-containing protein, partial [Gemmatimonadota bacterium]